MSEHECPRCGNVIVTGDANSRHNPPELYCKHDENMVEMDLVDPDWQVSDYLNGSTGDR